jgi:hypothetical protein
VLGQRGVSSFVRLLALQLVLVATPLVIAVSRSGAALERTAALAQLPALAFAAWSWWTLQELLLLQNLFLLSRLLNLVLLPSAFLAALALAAAAWLQLGWVRWSALAIAAAAVLAHATVLLLLLRYRRFTERILESMKRKALAESPELGRVTAMFAAEAGERFQAGLPNRFPIVPAAQPLPDLSLFPWIPALEAQFAAIHEEVLANLGKPQRYYDSTFLVNKRWKATYFLRNGVADEESRARFPVTTRAVETLVRPAGEFMISYLEPGAYLIPHVDVVPGRLTCHLPIVVPGSCGLQIGGETIEWEPGRCVVLDTTFVHDAWNFSDQPRFNLLFDLVDPRLSENEQQLVTAMSRPARRASQ